MSTDKLMLHGSNHEYFSYGKSRLRFRGPFRDPNAVDVTVMGGTEIFGKFVNRPISELLEGELARPVANLGVVNAGPDTFLSDPATTELCVRARVNVLQIMGAHGLSNAYYSVHQRRNDRFVSAHEKLRNLFPYADFSDCNFTRHLLHKLRRQCRERYAIVVDELRRTWMAKMIELIGRVGEPMILLWISDHAPDSSNDRCPDPSSGDPLLVTSEMVEQLASTCHGYVEVVREFGPAEAAGGRFPSLQSAAAARLPGPSTHFAAARALARTVQPLL